jgi:hypothetical protein
VDQFTEVEDKAVGTVVAVELHPVKMAGGDAKIGYLVKYLQELSQLFTGIRVNPSIISEDMKCGFNDLVVENVRAEFIVNADQFATRAALDFLARRKIDATANAGSFLLERDVAAIQSPANEVMGGRRKDFGKQVVEIRA